MTTYWRDCELTISSPHFLGEVRFWNSQLYFSLIIFIMPKRKLQASPEKKDQSNLNGSIISQSFGVTVPERPRAIRYVPHQTNILNSLPDKPVKPSPAK